MIESLLDSEDHRAHLLIRSRISELSKITRKRRKEGGLHSEESRISKTSFRDTSSLGSPS